MTKQQSAQVFKRTVCRFYVADAPFNWAAYRGAQSVSRPQFGSRFRAITRQARKAEASYNRILSGISYHPFHRSVRQSMRQLLDVSERQQGDLFNLGYVSNRAQGWREFNDWQSRNPRWNNLVDRVQQELGIINIRC